MKDQIQGLQQNLIQSNLQISSTPQSSSKAFKAKQKYYSKSRVLKGTNIFSSTFFTWISSLLSFGNHVCIDTDDMPKLPPQLHPKIQFERLGDCLNQVQRSDKKAFTLIKAIAKCYWRSLLALLILSFIITAMTMTAPILTHRIIKYIKIIPEQRSTEQGILLILGISFITIGKAILQSHLYYQFAVFGFNLSNTLSLLLFKKSLRYPALCQKKYSTSQIINLAQVDAQRMTNMGTQLTSVLYTPLQILLGIWLMYTYIGVSFSSGMATMLCIIGCTFFIAKKISKVNEQTLRRKDARMKATQQILDIIRFIKVNAAQKFFFKRLDEKRSEQLKSNRKRGVLEVLVVFLYFLSCPLIIFLTFLTFILLQNDIDSTVAFSTMMIFNILQSPLRQFPSSLSNLIQMLTSLQRIQGFLFAPQINYRHHRFGGSDENKAIRVEEATFRWGQQIKSQRKISQDVKQYRRKKSMKMIDQKQQSQLYNDSLIQSDSSLKISQKNIRNTSKSQISTQQYSNIQAQNGQKVSYIAAIKDANFAINKGKFVMILGDIGSGKSSLLLGLLNQMKISSRGLVQINGSIAYCSQKPCIMSGTVRQNILFGLAYQKRKFDLVLKMASLEKDLKLLVRGQFTQIGQKGVNLSGGQKARISLARALYSDRQIYFFDDIISAVDVNVAQFIIKQTIKKSLRNKTIILPTHAVGFAQCSDEIIVLKKGTIVRKGAFYDICDTPEFKQVYAKSLQKDNLQSKQDLKIDQELKKIKQTTNLIKAKKSMKVSVGKTSQSFTEKAVQQLVIPEDHRQGSIDKQVLKNYVKLNGGIIFVLVVLGSMTGWLACSILASMQMRVWCQYQSQGDFPLYLYLIFSIGGSLCAFLRAYTLVISGFKQGETVHKHIIQSLLYASLNQFYSRVPVGRIMNRLTKDLRQLDQTIGYAMGNFLTNLFSLFGTLAICVYGSTPYMIIPAVIVIWLCDRLRQYYMRTQRQVIRVQAKTNSPIVSGFISAIHGLQTIRAYQAEQQFLQNQMRRIQVNKASRITRQALQSWFAFRLTLLSFFISVLSIGWALLDTNSLPATVGLLLSYAFNLNDDIISLTFSWANLQTRMVSIQRLFSFMKIQPEKDYESYMINWSPKEEGYVQIVKKGDVEFRNVSVRYRPDLPFALKSVSFKLYSGQKVGVVGRTGAGKSTLFSVLLRLMQPEQGTVLLDGVDYNNYSLKDLRHNMTVIDQQPVLFNSTFRQNLDFSGKYTDQQLYQVLEQCNLVETIMEKDGLGGAVDNKSLSAGQKQLICICRAFLKKSKIVIIDEATANIDSKNDQLIQKVLQQKFKQSTVFTIAHRLQTLKNSDKIMVMGQGRVREFGTPLQLQLLNGLYAQMMSKNGSQFLV